jgi:hypothetical protein
VIEDICQREGASLHHTPIIAADAVADRTQDTTIYPF